MKLFIPAVVAATMLASVALAQTVNFDNLKTGAPPPGWTATKTGSGSAKWTIKTDATAPSKPNVLKQSGEATYPVCIKDDTNLKDGFVEVKFKPISGKPTRQAASSGGPRMRTTIMSPAPMRSKTTSPSITQSTADVPRKKHADMKVATKQWHDLRIDFQANHFTVTLDGKKALEWDDETFKEAGKVGVWTKADSVTLFDDFVYGAK